jgi:phage baseplate assembly protein W
MANLLINLNTKTKEQISKKWVYKDIRTPFDYDFKENIDVNAVRGAISNLLNWKIGQRILNPQFGNGLESFLYEQLNETTIMNIKTSLTKLFEYEPRANIINIDVIPKEDNEILINVEYKILKIGLTIKDSIIVTK